MLFGAGEFNHGYQYYFFIIIIKSTFATIRYMGSEGEGGKMMLDWRI